MSRPLFIGIAVAVSILASYVGSYLLIREYDSEKTHVAFRFRETVVIILAEDANEADRIEMRIDDEEFVHVKAASKSSKGYFLSFLYVPLWRIEAMIRNPRKE